MKNKKSIIALSAALIAVLAVGSSLALQTDVTNDVNVMTLGDIEIAQHEYERAVDENGEWIQSQYEVYGYKADLMQPFTQNKTLQPAFYLDGKVKYDDRVEGHQQPWAQVGAEGSNQLFDDSVKNVIDKFVFVENTGSNDAYYRTIIAIEWPEELKEDGDKDYIHVLINANSRFVWEDLGYYTIDGTQYLVKEATYTEVLKPGEVSRPSLLQVYLDPKATNEDVELFGGSLDIIVTTQATQVVNGADAERMLNAAFGENKLPWEKSTFVAPAINNGVMDIREDLIFQNEPLYSNTTATEAVTINGNGNTIIQTADTRASLSWNENRTIPATSNVFSSSNGAKVTINELNFKGTSHSIMLGHYVNSSYNNFNTELNKVNVIGLNVVSFSGGIAPAVTVYGNATLNNTNIYGTKLSALDTDPMWPVYDLATVNYTITNINNSKIGSIYTWNHALVNINEGSVVDTVLTASTPTKGGGIVVNNGAEVKLVDVNEKDTYAYKVAITIKAGATVETLDLTGADSRAKIIVEDGAIVNNIINPNGAVIKTA